MTKLKVRISTPVKIGSCRLYTSSFSYITAVLNVTMIKVNARIKYILYKRNQIILRRDYRHTNKS